MRRPSKRRAQQRLKREAGVTDVPTFVVGDQVVVGAQIYEVLETLVRDAGAEPR